MSITLSFYEIKKEHHLHEFFLLNSIKNKYPAVYKIIKDNTIKIYDYEDECICPSTKFIRIYDELDELKNKNFSNYDDIENKLIKLIKIKENNIEDIENIFNEYIYEKKERYINTIKNNKEIRDINKIMNLLKKYTDKNFYLYLKM